MRVFVHPAWPIEDMPFGEGLYSERFGFEPGGPEANQFPFRTDFGNAHLPWFQLQPGELPPLRSEHRVSGELVNVDLAKRAGQFRTDRTGEGKYTTRCDCTNVHFNSFCRYRLFRNSITELFLTFDYAICIQFFSTFEGLLYSSFLFILNI